MENGSNTYKEIREIAPLVADLIGSNPYTVPVGYFASLSTEIISRVTLPLSVGMVSPYRIPNGYFDHLAGSVMQNSGAGICKQVYRNLPGTRRSCTVT